MSLSICIIGGGMVGAAAAVALAKQGHLGLKGTPVVLRRSQVTEAFGGQDAEWKDYFTMRDLEKAVTDDFLDAAALPLPGVHAASPTCHHRRRE